MTEEPTPSVAAIAGHPIHPMIVPLPIGFLVGALVTDVVFWITGDAMWGTFSFWLIAAGIATALLAAAVGFIDFAGIKKVRERKAGWLHMYLNLGAVVVSVINVAIRWDDTPESEILWLGLALSALVNVLLVFSGWYGGELSYRHKVGVMR